MKNYVLDDDNEEILYPLNKPKSYTYNYINDYDIKDNINDENIELRNEIDKLKMILNQKNKEIEENRNKYDNQLIQINKTFDNHINEYQELVQKYENTQQELNTIQNELQQKNKIINDLKRNKNMNSQYIYNNNHFNNSFNEGKLIQFLQILKDKIKKMFLDFFNEENNEDLNNNNIIINFAEKFDNIFNNNNDIESKFKSIIQFINVFSQELSEFKIKINNNFILKDNNIENNNNNIFQKFYLKFIDTMNNFISNISFNFFNFNDFPKFSLNDTIEKKYSDILFIFNKLIYFIIEYQENNNNDINEELEKRLEEMTELLNNSNNYLNKAKEENKELKKKYHELEQKYLNIIDFNKLNNKLNIELNKKNQQIKSLENMVTILTNNSAKKYNKNKNLNNTFNDINNNNATSKSMITNNSFCGKIVHKKIYNQFKNNLNKSSFYLNNNNKFIKDEKNEIDLNNFLNKYTNGEYGKNNYNDNNTGIMNLKEEIEKYEKGIGFSLSEDEIEKENNYNEEEEEKKYQMEGKI